jgi:hypothetical protein
VKVAKKTNPELWEKSKAQAKAKMGGKHSARAMQLAVSIYKKAGGGYSGAKTKTSLSKYAATTRAKRKGTEKGKQFVAQPKAIAKKIARFRK